MTIARATETVPVEEWLQILQQEYLEDFVAAGGSTVKVVSGDSQDLERVRSALAACAEKDRYLYAHLDPTEVDETGKKKDLHRIDRFFFEVTRDVDFKGCAAGQIQRHLEKRGVHIAPGRALSDVEGIAADNGRLASDLLNEYQRELATPQIRDFGMAVEFRTAVTALGRVQLMPDSVVPTTEEVLLNWFAGRSVPGGATALKKIQIYDRISQANARTMLASFCRWIQGLGHRGLVVTLDFRPYEYKKMAASRRQADMLQKLKEAIARGDSHDALARLTETPEPFPVHYSDSAYQQMLSMIRRFIDEIDWFERFMLVILTSPSFYAPESPRNYFNYDALQTRIGLEVRGAGRANPAASLVHLGGD